MAEEINQNPKEPTQPARKSEKDELQDEELDEVDGGCQNNLNIGMLSKIIQAKNDMQKGIIQNFRA